MTDRTQSRDILLLAALPHVTFDGWTRTALEAGARDAGMIETDVLRYFPGGAREALEHFSDWADRRMTEALKDHDLENRRVRDRIALGARLRLEALLPHREAVRRSIAAFALPPNMPLAATCLYRTVDAIWYAAGDRSADFNFYSKRALLAGVVSTTTLYWLEDESDDCRESWEFLERRISNVLKIPALGNRLKRYCPNPFRILRGARGI
jgi:ubiquinone biosynthesis protein COQ9